MAAVTHAREDKERFKKQEQKKLTPESERGSSVCLASTSLLLDSRARGLHLPQRRNTGAHSRLPDTHRCGGRLKITPFSRSIVYRRLQRIPGEGFLFSQSNAGTRWTKTNRVSLLVWLRGAPESDCHTTGGSDGSPLTSMWLVGREVERQGGREGGSKREERGSLLAGGGQINLGACQQEEGGCCGWGRRESWRQGLEVTVEEEEGRGTVFIYMVCV